MTLFPGKSPVLSHNLRPHWHRAVAGCACESEFQVWRHAAMSLCFQTSFNTPRWPFPQTMRTSSSKAQIAYNDHAFRYVNGVKLLYPDRNLKPIHHVSLHIGNILGLFGPVHSHSAQFYERYIMFLRSISQSIVDLVIKAELYIYIMTW
jgi:hypothetical protein